MPEDPKFSEGQALPVLRRSIELPDMVAYAGATWDWHRLHYDTEYAAKSLLPGPVVDGQVLGAYLAEQLLDSFGPRAFIRKMSFRFRSMVFAGETITCNATIVSDGYTPSAVIGVEQEITIDDRLVVSPAKAEVVIHDT